MIDDITDRYTERHIKRGLSVISVILIVFMVFLPLLAVALRGHFS